MNNKVLSNNIFVRISLYISSMILVLVFSSSYLYADHLSQNNSKMANKQKGNSITVSEVVEAQSAWANGIVAIGQAYLDHKDYQQVAKNLINKLYAYNYEAGIVLFKPTKASETPFRQTKKSALSYFVGGDTDFSEDKGFAITPWTKVVFHNDEMYLHGDIAIAMGSYDFTDTKGKVTTVEYTFAYVKTKSGALKIVLHHSSIPFSS